MKQTSKNAGIGMVLGMCIGVGVGSVIDSFGIPMGLCFGMLIGLAIGANKDKIVNKQVAEKGYKIKVIEKELFKEGDIVFIDEDGDIEQAFDEGER